MASLDAVVCRWQGFDGAHVQQMRKRFRRVTRAQVGRWPAYLAVCDRSSGAFLGVYSVLLSDRPHGVVHYHLGWWLNEAARGDGRGTESLALVLDHVHESMGIEVVVMGTEIDNVRAIRQIERVGSSAISTAPYLRPDGATVESVWYEHTRGMADTQASGGASRRSPH